VGRPLPNAALLGGFAGITGMLKIESVIAAIRAKFAAKIADANVLAAQDAYDSVRRSLETETVHA
jgi:pyruvate ferredoxin oxidoreductase gamma subunit